MVLQYRIACCSDAVLTWTFFFVFSIDDTEGQRGRLFINKDFPKNIDDLKPPLFLARNQPQLSEESSPIITGLVHVCKICGKSFKHAGSLSMHKRLHSGDTHCNLCGKVFSRMYYLKVHMHIHHKTEMERILPTCKEELD